MQKQYWVMGLWKFSDKIPQEDLGKVAEDWAWEDGKYTELYIRKVSKDQNGIGFTYKLADNEDPEQGYDQYKDKTSDFLKRKFGNDLVGWDMACPVWIIK